MRIRPGCRAAGLSAIGLFLVACAPAAGGGRLLKAEEGRIDRVGAGTADHFLDLRWNRLTEAKEAIDAQFLPIFLLRELGARNPVALCRVLAFNYDRFSRRRRPVMSGPAGGARRLRTALADIRLSGRVCSFRVVTASLSRSAYYYPILIDWRGEIADGGGVANPRWHEPAFAGALEYFYPADVSYTGVEWGPRSDVAYFRSQRGPNSELPRTYASDVPLTGNVMASGFDSVLGYWPAITSPAILAPAVVPRPFHGALTFRGPVGWRCGAGRKEEFHFTNGSLRYARIFQPGIRLFERLGPPMLVTASSGGHTEHAMFTPHTWMPYLRGGRTIVIKFSPNKADPHTVLPKSIRIRHGVVTTFVARYLKLHYYRGHLPKGSPWPAHRLPGISQANGRLAALGIWPGAQDKAHPKYFSVKQLAPTVAGYLVRKRLFYNAYAAAYKWNWPELAITLKCYRRLLRADHIPYRFYLFSVEALISGMRKMVGSQQANATLLAKQFLEPAYARLTPDTAARQVARLVDQYHYGFALVALQAIDANSASGEKLRAWAHRRIVEISGLIHRIAKKPARYRIYFLENLLIPWKSFTRTNEALVNAFGSPMAKVSTAPIRFRGQTGRPHAHTHGIGGHSGIAAAAETKPTNIRGLHEVWLAVRSVGGLSHGERRALIRIARRILKPDHGLDAAKRKVVFAQTRRYLQHLVDETHGGGREGAELLEKTFFYGFSAYARLPDVTEGQRDRAATLFKRCYAAMKAYVEKTFTDTPAKVQRQMEAEVGRDLEHSFVSACDYYHPQMLYVDKALPSVATLMGAFERYPFANQNPTAFAETELTLQNKQISKLTKQDAVSSYVWMQCQGVTFRAGIVLRKYFQGNNFALFLASADQLPPTLVKQWEVFGQAQFAKARARQAALQNRSLYKGLVPTGRQILRGSGVQEY